MSGEGGEGWRAAGSTAGSTAGGESGHAMRAASGDPPAARRRAGVGPFRSPGVSAALVALAAAACAGIALAGAAIEAVRGSGSVQTAAALLGVPRNAHGGTARIAYAGIVPYVDRRSQAHPRAVACGGESSVACVLSEAEDGLRAATSGASKQGAGRKAVEEAAQGRGFAPWRVSHQSKAARAAARRAVAQSGHGHALDWVHSIWRGAENLDHEIDYGGRALPARSHRSDQPHGARRGRKARAAESAISKTVLVRLLCPSVSLWRGVVVAGSECYVPLSGHVTGVPRVQYDGSMPLNRSPSSRTKRQPSSTHWHYVQRRSNSRLSQTALRIGCEPRPYRHLACVSGTCFC
jgi:hypothetical protein